MSKKRPTLLIEGAGDVVMNYYSPALQKLNKQREFDAVFSDSSLFWKDDAELRAKMLGIRASLEGWGARYLDKNNPEELKSWEDLEVDVVVVATPDSTHSEVAGKWLDRNPGPQRIFIEKPLDSSIASARRLLSRSRPYDKRISAFDHYRARLLPARAKFDMLGGFLKEGLRSFTFYFLEDHSGADPGYGGEKGARQGPIENDRRVKALKGGVILDLMPHVIAILAHFGKVETLRVTRVRPGKYEGVDGKPGKLSEIDCETFAEVRFVFEDHLDRLVAGAAFVGKGVRGTEVLGEEHYWNTKFLRVESKSGRRVDIDFRKAGNGASKACLVDEHGELQLEFGLNPDPYYTFLDEALNFDRELNDKLGLSIETGKKVLEVIEDMRQPILEAIREKQRGEGQGVSSYPCGIQGVRLSPLLEDLVYGNQLRLVYGSEEAAANVQ